MEVEFDTKHSNLQHELYELRKRVSHLEMENSKLSKELGYGDIGDKDGKDPNLDESLNSNDNENSNNNKKMTTYQTLRSTVNQLLSVNSDEDESSLNFTAHNQNIQ